MSKLNLKAQKDEEMNRNGMARRAWVLASCLFAMFCYGETATAQRTSLWQRRTVRMTDRYSDIRALRPGDLLTITINQSSQVQNRDNRLMDHQGKSSSKLGGNYGLSGGLGGGTGGLTADHEADSKREFSGNAQFRSQRQFVDTFAVKVIDVLENGTMLVAGTRDVWISGDNRKLVLTGIVRPADIAFDNTIPSSRVADLVIRYATDEAEGSELRFLNQGWLGKKLGEWLPF